MANLKKPYRRAKNRHMVSLPPETHSCVLVLQQMLDSQQRTTPSMPMRPGEWTKGEAIDWAARLAIEKLKDDGVATPAVEGESIETTQVVA